MTSERLKIIENILGGFSSRIRETFFEKNHKDVYVDIIEFTSKFNISFPQRIWYWVENRQIEFKCLCGNKTSFNKNWRNGYRKYCSSKCAQINENTKNKRKSTNLEKYGVENVAQSKEVQSKIEVTNLERYGCKSSFQNRDVRDRWKRGIKNKYGVDHIFQMGEIKNQIRVSNLEKYGKESYTQTNEYLEKTKKTNLEKYGSDWYTQTDEWIEKTKTTNLEKFGVEWYQMTKEYKDHVSSNRGSIVEKAIKTNNEKWGKDWYSQTEEYKNHLKSLKFDYTQIQEKAKKTSKERYGVEFYPQTIEWRIKTVEKNRQKFGKDWHSETDHWKEKMKLNGLDRLSNHQKNKSIQMCKDLGFILVKSYGHDLFLVSESCGHEFTIRSDTFYKINYEYGVNPCTICNPIEKSQSFSEIEIINWIKSFGLDVEEKNRSICGGYEIDMFIESKKIAIEFNGLYWHSERYRDKNYHLMKSSECLKKGINLIHIWEDDWKNRKHIIQSIILNKLGLIEHKIYARKCEIKDVDNSDSFKFLNDNHIQGYSRFSDSVGLYYNKELVSLMTFGFRSTNGKREYELIRFCNKINTNVIGAASKLFSYFLKNNSEINEINSYADISIFSGDIYPKIGFSYSHRSSINYWWVVDGIRRHRFNFNKKKLVNMGYSSSMTESEIMYSLGHYRIWGCGQDKWTWKRV